MTWLAAITALLTTVGVIARWWIKGQPKRDAAREKRDNAEITAKVAARDVGFVRRLLRRMRGESDSGS